MRKSVVAVLAAVVLVVSGCGGDPLKGGSQGGAGDSAGGGIVVGSFDFPESRILAHIYAEALRNAGAKNVTVPASVGGRKIVLQAMREGSLDLVAEYSGNLLRYFDKDTTATTSDEVYAQLRKRLREPLRVLEQAPAQNKDQLVIRKELAATGISTISELASRCDELVFGGPGQWEKRWAATIKQLYGCDFKSIEVTDTGGPVTVSALRSGDIDVANLFSTDPAVRRNGFVALEDDKHMYPAQNVVPLTTKGVLTDKQQQALNAVSNELTTEKLTQLNVELGVKKRNPADIAKDFLESNGLA